MEMRPEVFELLDAQRRTKGKLAYGQADKDYSSVVNKLKEGHIDSTWDYVDLVKVLYYSVDQIKNNKSNVNFIAREFGESNIIPSDVVLAYLFDGSLKNGEYYYYHDEFTPEELLAVFGYTPTSKGTGYGRSAEPCSDAMETGDDRMAVIAAGAMLVSVTLAFLGAGVYICKKLLHRR